MTTRDENSPQSGSNTPQDDSGQTSSDDSAQSSSPESLTPHEAPESPSAESEAKAETSAAPPTGGEATDDTEAAGATDSEPGAEADSDSETADDAPIVQMEFVSPAKPADAGDEPEAEPSAAEPGITVEFVSPPQSPPEGDDAEAAAEEPDKDLSSPPDETGRGVSSPPEATADSEDSKPVSPPAIPVTFSSPPRKERTPPAAPVPPRPVPSEPPPRPPASRPDTPPPAAPPPPVAPPSTPAPPAPTPRERSRKGPAVAVTLVFVLLAATLGVVAITNEPTAEQGYINWPEYRMSEESDPVLGALSDDAPIPDPDLMADAIAPALGDDRLEGDLAFTVADAKTGDVLFDQNGDQPLTPASSTKTLTSVAAMSYLGVDHRISTSVVEGENENTVVIVGGGDATLQIDDEGFYHGAASLQDLADQVLDARDGESPERVVYDISLFSGDIEAPGTNSGDYAQGQTARMQALMVNGGRAPGFEPMDSMPYQRYDDPAESAAEEFADLLGADEVVEGEAPSEAAELAVVQSAPMMRLVEDIMRLSDNTLSDAVAFLVANEIEDEASYPAVESAQLATLEDLDIPTDGITVLDGSGLSRDTLITSEAFTRLLVLSSEEPHLTPVVDSLPIAGHFGSLLFRFDTETGRQAYGNARGKTGTLNEVSSLSGSVVTTEGRQLVFSMIINERDWLEGTQEAMDNVIAELAACGCN